MRRNLYNWALIMGILLFGAACSSDDSETLHPDSQPIRFAVSPATLTDGETRAVVSGNYLPVADSVGIFAYSYTTSLPVWSVSPDLFDNVKGTVGALPSAGEAQEIMIAAGAEKKYVGGRKHAFYSYYPYRSSLSATSPVLESDLFSELETNKTQFDWLWAEPVIGVMTSTTPVGFTYSHLMSSICIVVAKNPDVNATLKMESITVGTSTSQKFTFNVSTGVITKVLNGFTVYTAPVLSTFGTDVPASTAKLAVQTLLLPVSKVTSLSFRINGEDFTTPSDWVGFDTSIAGKYKMVNVVINASEITIQLGGQDWVDDDIVLSQISVSISLGAKDWDYDPATDIVMAQSKVSISLGAKEWVDDPATDIVMTQPNVSIPLGAEEWVDGESTTISN